jgi:hypothetical protein
MAPTLRPCLAGCGAMVLRARTEALKWQELNPEPDPAGNTAVRRDHQDNLFARGLRKGEQPAPYEEVYMPHKATCGRERARRPAPRADGATVVHLSSFRAAQRARRAAAGRAAMPRVGPPGSRYNPGRDR